MDQVKVMMLAYIDGVDDETFLTTIIREKHYDGRDILAIAMELELLDIIMNTKVEAVIKRYWGSDFDTSGSFFEMSTSYQILTQPSATDIETENRFYRSRDIEGKP